MNSSGEAASGTFAVGLSVGGKRFGTNHMNPVLPGFLVITGDHESRDRVRQSKYLWKRQRSINVIEQVMGKASSARCGSRCVHSIKLFQTGANVKKGAGMTQETDSLSWEETDRIEKAVWPRKYVRVQMPETVVSAKACSWHKNKGL